MLDCICNLDMIMDYYALLLRYILRSCWIYNSAISIVFSDLKAAKTRDQRPKGQGNHGAEMPSEPPELDDIVTNRGSITKDSTIVLITTSVYTIWL